jgi:hypothetical protein
MQKLQELKDEYNYWLKRNAGAEEYFKTHTVKECIKYLPLFNEVTQHLSNLVPVIEKSLGRNMTYQEKLQGFRG